MRAMPGSVYLCISLQIAQTHASLEMQHEQQHRQRWIRRSLSLSAGTQGQLHTERPAGGRCSHSRTDSAACSPRSGPDVRILASPMRQQKNHGIRHMPVLHLRRVSDGRFLERRTSCLFIVFCDEVSSDWKMLSRADARFVTLCQPPVGKRKELSCIRAMHPVLLPLIHKDPISSHKRIHRRTRR